MPILAKFKFIKVLFKRKVPVVTWPAPVWPCSGELRGGVWLQGSLASIRESQVTLLLCDWSVSPDEDRLYSSDKLTPQISGAWRTRKSYFQLALHIQC